MRLPLGSVRLGESVSVRVGQHGTGLAIAVCAPRAAVREPEMQSDDSMISPLSKTTYLHVWSQETITLYHPV